MAKRKKAAKRRVTTDRFAPIEAAVAKMKKAELVALVGQIARDFPDVRRALESKLEIQKPVEVLLADVASAIVRATYFDDCMVNYNFDYDYQAYEEVRDGFKSLIRLGHLEDVKSLALRLMKDGSYQVECSDEGLMADDVADCLKPVIRAVASADGDEAKSWAAEMIAADRVGFICDRELSKMADGRRA